MGMISRSLKVTENLDIHKMKPASVKLINDDYMVATENYRLHDTEQLSTTNHRSPIHQCRQDFNAETFENSFLRNIYILYCIKQKQTNLIDITNTLIQKMYY